jgi:hypothetical protein
MLQASLASEQVLRHTLETLRCVRYDAWGSTSPMRLPTQTGQRPDHDAVVRQLLRGLVDAEPSVARMEPELRSLFLSPAMEEMVKDLFWIQFLEYFVLIDPRPRLEKHKAQLQAQFEQEEEQRVRSSRRRNSRTYYLRRKKDPNNSTANHESPRKAPNSASNAPAEEPVDKSYVPRHLRESSKHSGPREGNSPSRPNSAASNLSRAESVKSVLSASSAGVSAATTLLDDLIAPPSDSYEGKIELTAVVYVLKSAELIRDDEVDDRVAERAGRGGGSNDELSVARREALTRAAIDLIRTEQGHMLDRVAACYVTILRSVKAVKRDVVMGPLPDALGQLLAQLFHRVLPYMRGEVSARIKRLMKRRITYWFSGVENGDVRRWSAESNTSLLTAPLLREGSTSSLPTSRRGSVQARHTPQTPSIDAASKWKSVGTKAKAAGLALTGFSEAGAMHDTGFTANFLAFRKEMRHALMTGPNTFAGFDTPKLPDLAAKIAQQRENIVMPMVPAPPPSATAVLSRGGPATARSGAPHHAPVEVRHVKTHRFALDPRPPRWHEAGRRRSARMLQHDSPRQFNNSNLTPLMSRFLKTNDATPTTRPNSLMSWSV